eukprot:SM000039S14422  [mRNA]  locus=s39:18023:18569:- [translate_table: standard]
MASPRRLRRDRLVKSRISISHERGESEKEERKGSPIEKTGHRVIPKYRGTAANGVSLNREAWRSVTSSQARVTCFLPCGNCSPPSMFYKPTGYTSSIAKSFKKTTRARA